MFVFINFRGPRDFINGGGLLIQGGDYVYIYIYMYIYIYNTYVYTVAALLQRPRLVFWCFPSFL